MKITKDMMHPGKEALEKWPTLLANGIIPHPSERECHDILAYVAELEGALDALITDAKLLHQNAEGCAVNHYGEDYYLHGRPGWLSDTEATIAKAVAVRALIEQQG